MATEGPYDVGQTVELAATLTRPDNGQPFLPTSGGVFVVREPVDGAEMTVPATEVAPGEMRGYYTVAAHGRHRYRFAAPGARAAAKEEFFDAKRSRIV